MVAKTLLEKVWEAHTVRQMDNGETQLFVALHLIHEVTSPQAFAMLEEMELPVRLPSRTVATAGSCQFTCSCSFITKPKRGMPYRCKWRTVRAV